jgi:hypothetical protein
MKIYILLLTVENIDSNWNYKVHNDEEVTSNLFISQFELHFHTLIFSINSPTGWSYKTDNISFISWKNDDLNLPYTHDVAPQSTLEGFSFQSLAAGASQGDYEIFSWDHSIDDAGDIAFNRILVPNSSVSAPEPSTLSFLVFLSSAGFGTKCLLGPRKNVSDQCKLKK